MIAVLLLLFQGPQDFEGAEILFRQGRYEEAFDLLQAAQSEPNLPQGPLLYNLGNCLFRLGHHPEAVWFYRRALLRLPRDPELKFNLRLAEQHLGIGPPTAESLSAAALALVDSLAPRELLLLACALQGLGLVSLVLLRWRPAVRIVMILVVLLGLAGAARLWHTHSTESVLSGIVLRPEIVLRSEPHSSLPALLKLKAGETVRIEEWSDRWARVTHPKGSGWTERPGIGLVD